MVEGATHRVPSEQPALLASLLQDLVERTRAQQHAPSRDADGILLAAAHLLFTKRGTLGRSGRLTRIETWPARRAAPPTRVERGTH
ncbi:hypothetical protein [Streptomyces agglomeratus]|uniref:hypothetical protein n=1 Tax=Streptomyces agglomeratus TaxID=285458 RepID=UPI001F0B1F8D|nr:hypothetical protein [Streptomyces agglomeratus]